MRRTLRFAIALGGLGLCISALAPASSQALNRPGTIRVTTREVSHRIVDQGRRGRGAGDLELMRHLLYNKGITKRAIGHAEVVCTFTGRRSRVCNATYFLPKGKIMVAGALVFRQFYELAVLGGTGLYNNVQGSLTVTAVGTSPRRDFLTFRLVV
jgi:hypothetical protein